MNREVLIKVDHVSKKFCKDLKKSLKYGFQDLGAMVFGGNNKNHELRKDEFWAVKDVSFEVRRGECLGLIGHNGAGKSTLLKMLNGLINPDGGTIEMKGKVGALIELGAGFNPILTGKENIYNSAAVYGFTKEETDAKLEDVIEFSELRDFLDMPVQNYSSGMKVRLGFAVAASMEPDILLVDEVLAVGDIGFRIKCLNRIQELLKNCAVILVSHSMPQIGKICTSAMLMDKGKNKMFSTSVGDVIEGYFERFDTEQAYSIGNGSCELLSIQLEGSELKNDIHFIKKDTFFELNAKILFHEKYDQIFCRFIFHDLETKAVAIVSSVEKNVVVKDLSSKTKLDISVRIRNLFMQGKYTLSLNVVELKNINGKEIQGDILLSSRNVLKLYSSGYSQIDYCPIELLGDWQVLRSKDELITTGNINSSNDF